MKRTSRLRPAQDITRRDLEHLLRFVAELHALEDDEPFPLHVLTRLGHLVPADYVTYCELDRVRRRHLETVCRPGDWPEQEAEASPAEQELLWSVIVEEHPVCVYHQRGRFDARRISDFMTLRELRSSRLHALCYEPDGVEYQLNVALPSPLWHTKTFLFDRARKDFGERDRTVLNLLQPHLAARWEVARTRRRLAAALAAVDRLHDGAPHGAIALGPAGEVDVATPSARRLVHLYLGEDLDGRLPAALADWLERGAPAPLVRRRDGRLLTIEHASGSVVLTEREDRPVLTARERDVLAWVARGKTNAEIARLLWISPGTVRRHLENVYRKLGVHTRTAAVARLNGLLDAQPQPGLSEA